MEKPLDHEPRKVVWWALRKKYVMKKDILAITKMYKKIKTSTQIDGKQSKK